MAKARIQMMPWNFSGVSVELPAYWCPVCRHPHSIPTKGTKDAPRGWKDRWDWNGSVDKPTFHPSVRTYHTKHAGHYWMLKRNGKFLCVPGTKKPMEFTEEDMAVRWAGERAEENDGQGWGVVPRDRGGDEQITVCHVHVTDGNIQILSDTPGPLGGTTRPLDEWDVAEYLGRGKA